ncbi:MAG: mechanosensitive ion channel family protein [Balneolaceae bacterium]
MENFKNSLMEYFQNSPDLTANILQTVGTILALWLIRLVVLRIVTKRTENKRTRYKWRKNLTYTASFLGIVIIGSIWLSGGESLATYLGLMTAGIAIALKDPVTDLAAWLFIIWRKPFDVGDRVQLGDTKGDVIDVRPFKFTVLEIGNWVDADQSTGRVIHVPNHYIFTNELANYTSDFKFIWNEVKVLVTFESDWKKAKTILDNVVNEVSAGFIDDAKKQIASASKSYLIEFKYLTPITYTDVRDSGINLTVRYLTDPRRRRGTSQIIWERILDEYAKHDDIDFAYPTIRYYDNPKEGKPGTTLGN